MEREEQYPAPVGVRLRCEVCGEESVVAIPAARARYGLVDCPGCRTGYLMLLAPTAPATRQAVAAG